MYHIPKGTLVNRIRSFVAALLVLAATVLGTLALAGTANAASYYDTVVAQLKATKGYVYSDVSARPTLPPGDVANLNQRIKATGKPIFIIFADDAQVANVTPTALPGLFNDSLNRAGVKSAVVAVSARGGFVAQGFNVPAPIAAQAGSLAAQVATGAGSPGARLVNFVDALNGVKTQTPSQPGGYAAPPNGYRPPINPSVPASSGSGNGWLILLWVLVAIVAVAALAFGGRWLYMRNKRKNEIKTAVDQLDKDLLNMTSQMSVDSPAYTAYSDALSNKQSAEESLAAGNYDSAEAYCETGRASYRQARRLLNGDDQVQPATAEPLVAHADTGTEDSDTERPRRKGGRTSRRRRHDSGDRVVVNNTTYVRHDSYSSDYPHHYQGGYIGGVYYPTGYYDPFFWAMAANAGQAHEYRDGYQDGIRDAERHDGNSWSSGGVTGQADGGAWNDVPETAGNGNSDNTSWADNGNNTTGQAGGGAWSSDAYSNDTPAQSVVDTPSAPADTSWTDTSSTTTDTSSWGGDSGGGWS